MLQQLTSQQAKDFIDQVGQPFKNAPHLPSNIVEFFVTIAPWLAGLGGILTLLGSLQMLSVALGLSPMGRFFQYLVVINPAYWWVSGILSLLSGLLLIMAFKPLQKRELTGWIYMFWVEILTILQMLVGLVMAGTNVVMAVLSTAIGLYLTFEMRSAYNGILPTAAAPEKEKPAKK